jgi:hypothetical protein
MTSDEDEDEQDEAVDDSEDGDAATVIDPDHDATHD